MSEIKSDKLTPVTATTTTFGDSGDKLLFATGTNLDMNGVELILDADADTSITADTDDQIDIRIAGADDFRFTANNFNVLSGSTLTIDSGATVTNSGTATGFTSAKLEASADTAAGDNAAMGYTAAEGLILTGQGSTDDITVKNDADVTVVNVATGGTDIEVSAGDLFFGTSGKGIVLGATTNTDANTMDDFEEGTWTPVPKFGASSIQSGTAASAGIYTKINRTVWFNAVVNFAVSGTGQFNITGFPFTSNSQSSTYAYTGSIYNGANINSGASLIGTVGNAETVLYIYDMPADATDSVAGMTHAFFGATATQLIVSGFYNTSS